MPRRVGAEEWRAVRDLRLRALADVPTAFAMTLTDAQQRTDDEWRERVAPGPESVTIVEDGPNGGLVGMAFGFFDPGTKVGTVSGMFVEPPSRGAGIGRRLVEAVETWARELGATRMELEVNPELNAAVRLYERCGYRRTGRSRPLPSRPSATAVEMSRTLS